VKEIVLPADGLDMSMLGDNPEWIEILRPGDAERIVGPEPAIGIVKAMIGVGCGINERRRNLGREVGVVTQAQNRNPLVRSRSAGLPSAFQGEISQTDQARLAFSS
jgi:hypothetical protein